MNAPARSPAHEQLRSNTCHLHQLVDNRFDLAALSGDAAYSAFLLAHWPFASIEAALETAGIHRVLPDWNERRRREALIEDLRQLGISPPSIDPVPIDPDRGTLFGWSYVLEGSRLGSTSILRAIDDHGARVTRATLFLRHGDGKNLWASFKAALSKIDSDPTAISKACTAAKLAFQRFLAIQFVDQKTR